VVWSIPESGSTGILFTRNVYLVDTELSDELFSSWHRANERRSWRLTGTGTDVSSPAVEDVKLTAYGK
jgi:hypothetical protein